MRLLPGGTVTAVLFGIGLSHFEFLVDEVEDMLDDRELGEKDDDDVVDATWSSTLLDVQGRSRAGKVVIIVGVVVVVSRLD